MADGTVPPVAPPRRRWIGLLAAGIAAIGVLVAILSSRVGGTRSVDRIALTHGAFRDFNVLLVSIDTLRADHVGCYGYGAVETPVLDSLARSGVRCAHAVANVPLTLPAHASLLTGLNPQHHGARANVIYALPDRVETLARMLRMHGYRTGAVISAFVLDRRFGLAQGFEDYADDLTADGRTQAFGYRERIAEDTNRHVLAWLDKHGREKFFLWVHYFDPHFPYSPPPPFSDRYKDRPYDGEIAYVDQQFGRLLARLDQMGLRGRTLVVVVGDHGESLGEHGELTHGLLLYDAALLVPMIFSGPEPVVQGAVIERQVGLIDVVPTVLGMLGIAPPKGLDGLSLLEPYSGGSRSIYIETLWPRLMHNWSPLAGVRRDDVKFIFAPKPELYELTADPNELNNLFGQRPQLAAELHQQLRELVGGDPEMLASLRGNLAVDEEARQKLAALGYVIASTAPTTNAALPDPKDMMGQWAESEQADHLANAGRHAEAVLVLQPFIRRNPSDIRAIGMLAECYMNLGRFQEAAEMFSRQASLSARKSEALAGLGLARIQQGRLDEAAAALTKSLREDPRNPAAIFGQGLIAAARGRDAESLALFEKCVAVGRGSQTAPAYCNIGILHEKAGRRDEAKKAFEQSLALDPHYVLAAQGAARILQSQGRLEEAIQVLRRAVANRPGSDARLQLGQVMRAAGRIDDAASEFRSLLKSDPNNPAGHLELGLTLNRLGKSDEAIEHLRRCLQLDPASADARLHLGVMLGQTGQLDQARAQLEQAVRIAPQWSAAHYNLGVVLATQHRLAEAEKAFAQAIRLDPHDANYRNALGQVLMQLDRKDEAMAQFRQALAIDPGLEPARENLTQLQRRQATTTSSRPSKR
jgi:choline-sulfatase